MTKRTRCEHGQTGASHTTHHKHLSTRVVPTVIPSKGAFSERFEFVEEVVVLAMVVKVAVLAGRRGSSRTRELVGSTATVVEVVVHDDGRGPRDSRTQVL